jgi:hypothetical protein
MEREEGRKRKGMARTRKSRREAHRNGECCVFRRGGWQEVGQEKRLRDCRREHSGQATEPKKKRKKEEGEKQNYK